MVIGQTTPKLLLRFHDQNDIEHQISREFLIDTAAIISSILQQMNPFPLRNDFIDVETGGSMQKQLLTKIEVVIDEYIYSILTCVTQTNSCILGMDILQYYTLTINGNKAGAWIKN